MGAARGSQGTGGVQYNTGLLVVVGTGVWKTAGEFRGTPGSVPDRATVTAMVRFLLCFPAEMAFAGKMLLCLLLLLPYLRLLVVVSQEECRKCQCILVCGVLYCTVPYCIVEEVSERQEVGGGCPACFTVYRTVGEEGCQIIGGIKVNGGLS